MQIVLKFVSNHAKIVETLEIFFKKNFRSINKNLSLLAIKKLGSFFSFHKFCVTHTQSTETAVGSKASRTRDPDSTFKNDGQIGERDQGRTSVASNQNDVSRISRKSNFQNFSFYRLPVVALSNLSFYFLSTSDRKKRSVFDLNVKNLQKLFRLSQKLGYKGNSAYPIVRYAT